MNVLFEFKCPHCGSYEHNSMIWRYVKGRKYGDQIKASSPKQVICTQCGRKSTLKEVIDFEGI